MRTRRARAMAATAAGAAVLGAQVPPVDASGAAVASTAKFVNGGHIVQAQGTYRHLSSTLTRWDSVRSAETTPLFGTVCNYQGWMGEVHPHHGLVFQQYSSHHPGCSFMIARFDWPGWNTIVARGTGLRAKWRSDTTPGGTWFTIGELRTN